MIPLNLLGLVLIAYPANADEPDFPDFPGIILTPNYPPSAPPPIASPPGPMSPSQYYSLVPKSSSIVPEYRSPDFDGDGQQDVIFSRIGIGDGQPVAGEISVYSGWTNQLIFEVASGVANDAFGFAYKPINDVDGDLCQDLLVGAPGDDEGGLNAGAVYLFSSTTGELLCQIHGETPEGAFGYSIASGIDLDGDGIGDIVAAEPFNGAGHVYIFLSSSQTIDFGDPNLFPGDVPLSMSTADADVVLQGESNDELFGYALSTTGDVNGDGVGDIHVGAPYFDDPQLNNSDDNRGRVYSYSGATHDLIGTITGNISAGFLGVSVSSAGDINNNGLSDVLVGVSDEASVFEGGRAYVFLSIVIGNEPISRTGAGADLVLSPSVFMPGENSDSLFGHYVALGNDIDRDGNKELVVHALRRDANGDLIDARGYLFSGADGSFMYTFTVDGPPPQSPQDDDGLIDQIDIVLSNFGMEDPSLGDGDLNQDGVIDAQDLIIAIENLYNEATAGPGSQTEPDCLGLIKFDPDTGEMQPCDDPDQTNGGGGPGTNDTPAGNAADEFCAQCDDLTLPDMPEFQTDCIGIAYCQMVDELCGEAQMIANFFDQKHEDRDEAVSQAEAMRASQKLPHDQARRNSYDQALAIYERSKSLSALSREIVTGAVLGGGGGFVGGSFIPGVGTAVGSIVGLAFGAIGGYYNALASAEQVLSTNTFAADAAYAQATASFEAAYQAAVAAAAVNFQMACDHYELMKQEFEMSKLDLFTQYYQQCLGLLP